MDSKSARDVAMPDDDCLYQLITEERGVLMQMLQRPPRAQAGITVHQRRTGLKSSWKARRADTPGFVAI
jgi:hypothetical protein